MATRSFGHACADRQARRNVGVMCGGMQRRVDAVVYERVWPKWRSVGGVVEVRRLSGLESGKSCGPFGLDVESRASAIDDGLAAV
jgi:hypothetical protein